MGYPFAHTCKIWRLLILIYREYMEVVWLIEFENDFCSGTSLEGMGIINNEDVRKTSNSLMPHWMLSHLNQ